MVNKERPVNLDLTKFRFPPMALVSIGHRVSGVLLFLLLPLLLYLFDQSLLSAAGYAHVQRLLMNPLIKCLVWVVCCAVLFHLVAGIRHLLMDLGVGESVRAGRASAITVFVVAIVLFILAGVWLW